MRQETVWKRGYSAASVIASPTIRSCRRTSGGCPRLPAAEGQRRGELAGGAGDRRSEANGSRSRTSDIEMLTIRRVLDEKESVDRDGDCGHFGRIRGGARRRSREE